MQHIYIDNLNRRMQNKYINNTDRQRTIQMNKMNKRLSAQGSLIHTGPQNIRPYDIVNKKYISLMCNKCDMHIIRAKCEFFNILYTLSNSGIIAKYYCKLFKNVPHIPQSY